MISSLASQSPGDTKIADIFQCVGGFLGASGCGRYFTRGADGERNVEVPAWRVAEVKTIGGWRCPDCKKGKPCR